MPLLLSDANCCSSDLGRILYASPSEWSVHMNIVDTGILSNLFSSHTEYKLSICTVPCNSHAVDIRFFDMWTRFRDVRRLWEQLAILHKKLHLRGSFPHFAEGVFFGSRSAQIVGERTSSITTFLNYVLCHPVLRQSKVLQDYFEKAQEITKPSNHEGVFDSSNDLDGISFEANTVHISKGSGKDSRFLFISESETSLAPGSFKPTTQLSFQSSPSIVGGENPAFNL